MCKIELLEKLLKCIEEPNYNVTGLCHLVYQMEEVCIISQSERDELHEYIEKHRPRWYNFKHYVYDSNHEWRVWGFYWPIGNLEMRIKWLEHRIRREKFKKNFKLFFLGIS